jgi:hypothetical protein
MRLGCTSAKGPKIYFARQLQTPNTDLTHFKHEIHINITKYSVPNSKKQNASPLQGALYSENHTIHINRLGGQNPELPNAKFGGTNGYHYSKYVQG